jgi:hypothetical protein
VSLLEERTRDVAADEARAARDEDGVCQCVSLQPK